LHSADTGADGALVSVIIPVRNEEAALPRLLASLETQTQPDIEYVFIDDGSTDKSPALLAAFKAQSAAPVTIIQIEDGDTGLALSTAFRNRKQEALAQGVAAARGGVLLFTDADCEAGPDWARMMTRFTLCGDTGAVLGPVYKNPAQSSPQNPARLLDDYQCFDQVVRGMYIAGAAGLGAASGAFGNNVAVRKTALDRLGGYSAIPVSITEDAAMIASARQKSGFSICAVFDERTHIQTRREPSWKALINQTLRWHHGGLFSGDRATALSFTALALFFFICTLCIPGAFFYPPLLAVPAVVFIEVFLGNIPARLFAGKSVKFSLGRFILLSFFIEYFFTLLTILSFLGRKPEWKR
jgi:cellulose synthase/poly-beta-1,6-N-acetylglucosamine synthase-like glycosyltransferase